MKKDNTAVKVIATAAKCPDFAPETIRQLMRKLDMNEKGLAILMNVTPETVRLWVAGAVKPCGTAKRLMQIYSTSPDIISKIVLGTEAKNAGSTDT